MPDAKPPIRWIIVRWVNLGMLTGCLVAFFIVPPTIRYSAFAASCLLAVIALNGFLYFGGGYHKRETKLPLSPAEGKRRRQQRVLLFAISWSVILWEIARRYWWK